jgi:transcription antitermination protein NusB
MSRRRAREFALQALYQVDTSDSTGRAALNGLWAGLASEEGIAGARPADEEERAFAVRLVDGVATHKERLDGLIEEASTNWRLARMPVVDRNILRLASFELAECTDVPANVSINEAIELAKKFGDKDSRAFVNGILDRIAAETGRGGRRHRGS